MAQSVVAQGAAGAQVSTTVTPGPGNFVSKGGRWYPAIVPKTYQIPDPINPERRIDTPMLDADGNAIMVPDPAALATIRAREGESAESMSIDRFPEPNDALKQQMEAANERMERFENTMVKVMETQSKLLEGLTAALGKKGPGRPPKEKDNG